MRIDYHTHTKLSKDNKQTIDELCKSCIDKNIEELCITEHIDFNPKDTCYGGFKWDTHKKNIEYANKTYNIKVLAGAEFDAQFIYMDKITEMIKQCDFDYIMGSCHYCHNVVIFNHPNFFEGKSQKKAYDEYFKEELEVIKTGIYDGISHFDLIKRSGGLIYGNYNPASFKDIIAECLVNIIKNDMTLEVNSSGLRHSGKEFYPNEYILRLYKDLGGINITYGSDGHNYEQDAYAIDEVYDLLKTIGFKYLVTYRKRKKIYVDY